jgi:hypothetical protein
MTGTGTEAAAAARPGRLLLFAMVPAAVLLVARAASSWYHMFAGFKSWDDEGYMMILIDQVHRGKALGDEVFTQYGPSFPLSYALFFRLTGLAVDHDTIRTITWVLWLLTPAILALVCFQITRRTVVSMIVFWAACECATVFCWEPGHPQGIACLSLALILVSAAVLVPKRVDLFSFLSGALAGYLLGCKINIGVFALLALGTTITAMCMGALARRANLLLACLAVLAPAAIMGRNLQAPGVARLCVFMSLSLAAVMVQVVARRSAVFSPRIGAYAVLGMAATLAPACLAPLGQGTSVSALIAIFFLPALRQADVFSRMLYLSRTAPIVAFGSLAASTILAWPGPRVRCRRFAAALVWAARVTFAAQWLLSPYSPFAFPFASVQTILFQEVVVSLAWVGMVPAQDAISTKERTVRTLAACLAVCHALVIYPVAGSQVGLARLFIVPVLGFVLHDLVTGVAVLFPAGTRRHAFPVALAVLAGSAVIASSVLQFVAERSAYRNNVALDLPGASRLRLPMIDVARYRFLAGNLARSGRDFLTLPGLNSLYFWAQKQPLTGLNATTWMMLFSDAEQDRIIAAARDKRDLWAVDWPDMVSFWADPRRAADKPLVRFLRSGCREVNSAMGISLRARAFHGSAELIQCVHWKPADARPAVEGQGPMQIRYRVSAGFYRAVPLGAIAIVDLESGEVLASATAGSTGARDLRGGISSQAGEPPPLQIRAHDFALDSAGELSFTMTRRGPAKPRGPLAVVLRRPNGEWLDILPMLDKADD